MSTEKPNSVCKWCGKPKDNSKHVRYGNDLDSPVKHEFEPVAEPAEPSCQCDCHAGKNPMHCSRCHPANSTAPQPVAGEANEWIAKVKDLLGEMQMFKDKQGFWLRAEQLLEIAPEGAKHE